MFGRRALERENAGLRIDLKLATLNQERDQRGHLTRIRDLEQQHMVDELELARLRNIVDILTDGRIAANVIDERAELRLKVGMLEGRVDWYEANAGIRPVQRAQGYVPAETEGAKP
jgi:hypothetical protein